MMANEKQISLKIVELDKKIDLSEREKKSMKETHAHDIKKKVTDHEKKLVNVLTNEKQKTEMTLHFKDWDYLAVKYSSEKHKENARVYHVNQVVNSYKLDNMHKQLRTANVNH
jgi:hypothetical protein